MKIQNIVPVFLVTTLLLAGCSSPVKVSEVKLPDVVPVSIDEVKEGMGDVVTAGGGVVQGVADAGGDAVQGVVDVAGEGLEAVSGLIEGGEDEIAPAPGVTPDDEVLSYDGEYILDTDASTLNWVGKKVGGQHNGTVDIASGEFVIVDGAGNGSFVLDMATISTLDLSGKSKEGMDSHLKNEDFFSVEAFPIATLVLKDVDVITGGVVDVIGDLTIKGITNSITFPAIFEEIGGEVVVTAEFSLDRTLWGIEYNSASIFSGIADKAIDDMMDFSVSLVFTQES